MKCLPMSQYLSRGMISADSRAWLQITIGFSLQCFTSCTHLEDLRTKKYKAIVWAMLPHTKEVQTLVGEYHKRLI
jgi:hypothetical protein